MAWTKADAEAEIARVLENAQLRGAIAHFDEARRAITRIGETSGRDDVAKNWLAKLQGLLPNFVEPPAPEWVEHTCTQCGYTRGVRTRPVEHVSDPYRTLPAGEIPERCPECRALSLEARLVPGPGDAWWTEIMQKGQHVSAQLAADGHDWACLPFSRDHVAAETITPIFSKAQVSFRGHFLVVDPETDDGMLLDLRIGPRSYFINSEPIPLSVFNPKNWGSLDAMREAARFSLDIAHVAQDVTLIVLMRRPGPFRATLWGPTGR